jgi:hypothetical protein
MPQDKTSFIYEFIKLKFNLKYFSRLLHYDSTYDVLSSRTADIIIVCSLMVIEKLLM